MKTTSSLTLAALSVLLSAASRFPSASASEEDYAQLGTEGFDDLAMSMPAEVGTDFAQFGYAPGGFVINPSVRAGARTCSNVCLDRVTPAGCPRDAPGFGELARLPFCYAETVPIGGFCDADGECGTNTGGGENCNAMAVAPVPGDVEVNRNVYRRVNCRLGGNSNGRIGAGNCQGFCVAPLDTTNRNTPCPNRPEELPKCDATEEAMVPLVAVAGLCEGSGECGTNQHLNNCGEFDVYRRVVCIPPFPLV